MRLSKEIIAKNGDTLSISCDYSVEDGIPGIDNVEVKVISTYGTGFYLTDIFNEEPLSSFVDNLDWESDYSTQKYNNEQD